MPTKKIISAKYQVSNSDYERVQSIKVWTLTPKLTQFYLRTIWNIIPIEYKSFPFQRFELNNFTIQYAKFKNRKFLLSVLVLVKESL